MDYDVGCRLCPRLAKFLDSCRHEQPDYHSLPVPSFGSLHSGLLIVGLAPGRHGANRTGRPFTGDHAGILLYQTLHASGFASAPQSVAADDGLVLHGARITNAVKCLPPANKPLPAEIRQCNAYLQHEIASMPQLRVILALGRIAHDAVLDAVGVRRRTAVFAHGAEHSLVERPRLIDSYHCSRYNTQTRRLTPLMFSAVVQRARALVEAAR